MQRASERGTRGLVLGLVLGLALAAALAPAGPGAAQGDRVDVGLDPGHSVADVGASGGGLREYELTLAVALRTRALLEDAGLRVALTRTNHQPLTPLNHPDAAVTRVRLEQEARIAAILPARIYVSIHFNGHPNPALRGTETYYNADNHGPQSRRLAEALQGAILAELRALGYDALDRGVKEDLTAGKPYGHFFSLRGPLPSALVEALFLTNPREAALLRETATLDALARGLAAGIQAYFRSEDGG
jgi:N-acetylmuramoyl-L-alanine amidase